MATLQRGGVTIAFDDTGGSGVPLVMLHGWMCDRTFMSQQVAAFSAHHRVVAMDLRGHGESDAPICEYTMDLLADDVARLCGRLKVERPVVIGHSMGAVVALELLAQLPSLPRSIVAIDAPIAMPQSTVQTLQRVAARFDAPGHDEAVRRFVNGLFQPTDNLELRHQITGKMVGGPHHVQAPAANQMFRAPSASSESFPRVDVPLLAIAAAGGHSADLTTLRTKCSALSVGQAVGAGHFIQLEVADQVNAMIRRFLQVTEAA
jgi:pimeloyl-ACP methyl ester carboxylesterase